MLVYIIPILFILFLSFIKIKGFNKNSIDIKYIIVFILAVIFCGGYMTGSDWRNYELLYETASLANIDTYTHEKGFYIYMCIFKFFGISFFPFLIISKFIVFYIISKFLIRYSSNFYLAVFFYLTMGAGVMFIFVDNPLRFMLALGVITLSYKPLLERRFFLFSFYIIIASFFHLSSILMFFVYFFVKIKLSTKYLAILYVLFYFIMTPQLMLSLIDIFFPFLKFLFLAYYKMAGIVEFSLFTIGKIFHLILFMSVLYCRDEIEDRDHGQIIFSLSVCSFLFFLIGNLLPTFHRFMSFTFLFLILSLVIVTKTIIRKNMFNTLLVLYCLLALIKNIYSTYVYIPYTNYFISFIYENTTYGARDRNNKDAYYLRTGESVEEKK